MIVTPLLVLVLHYLGFIFSAVIDLNIVMLDSLWTRLALVSSNSSFYDD